MSLDRKDFLKVALTGGLGLVFGGAKNIPASWREGGAKLVAVQRQSLVMGSVASFQVVAESEEAGYEAIRKAVQQFRRFDAVFSMYNPQSEMAGLAQHAGQAPITLSDDAVALVEAAKKAYEKTGGYFDITIEPVMRRWGFRKGNQLPVTRPTDRELQKLECLTGSDKLIIHQQQGGLTRAGMAIDTGGIAGGYALDKAIKVLKKGDIAAAFINFSGDIHCFGAPLSGKKWPVHIYDPQARALLSEPVYLDNQALSTSGAYQNRRHNAGNRSWGHLFLPSGAQPVEPVSSVTAIHSSAMMADIWSTATYVGALPPDDVKTIVIP